MKSQKLGYWLALDKTAHEREFSKLNKKVEKGAWNTFDEVIPSFLGNSKSDNYKSLDQNLLTRFKKVDCNMNVKVHFLHSHLEYFVENFGTVGEEKQEKINKKKQKKEISWEMEHQHDGWLLLVPGKRL